MKKVKKRGNFFEKDKIWVNQLINLIHLPKVIKRIFKEKINNIKLIWGGLGGWVGIQRMLHNKLVKN